jgi:hypothetical protein
MNCAAKVDLKVPLLEKLGDGSVEQWRSRRSLARATRKRRPWMLLGTCESSSSCDDDEVKNEDDGHEGVDEGVFVLFG